MTWAWSRGPPGPIGFWISVGTGRECVAEAGGREGLGANPSEQRTASEGCVRSASEADAEADIG